MIMSNEQGKQKSDVSSVEAVIEWIRTAVPVKSLIVVNDIDGGCILGDDDDNEYEQELAGAGAVYLVIGLGQMPTMQPRGIHFVDEKESKKR